MLGMVVHTIISATWETEAENPSSTLALEISETLYKVPLGSIPRTKTKTKTKKRKKISFITHIA